MKARNLQEAIMMGMCNTPLNLIRESTYKYLDQYLVETISVLIEENPDQSELIIKIYSTIINGLGTKHPKNCGELGG